MLSRCTTPPQFLQWLPYPVLKDEDHFKAYEEVKGKETTDRDRPSVKTQVTGKTSMKGATSVATGLSHGPKKQHQPSTSSETDASLYTAQNARYTLECVECRKPRIIYARNKLTDRLKTCLVMQISGVEYTWDFLEYISPLYQ